MIFLTLNICVPNKLQLNYNIAIYNITIFKISGWVTLLPDVELKTKDNIRERFTKKTFFGLCNVFLCTMAHMTKCSRVIQNMREAGKITNTELNFSDIYGTVDQQFNFIKEFEPYFDSREEVLSLLRSQDTGGDIACLSRVG